MSFSADWLTLRAAADRAARDVRLVEALADWVRSRRAPLDVTDVGAGTGATVSALHDVLPDARWRLIDNDPALLHAARRAAAALGATVTVEARDLGSGPEAIFAPAPALVTASAFFDLAGRDWIEAFAAGAVESGAAVYVALTYDGREDWRPPHPDDAKVAAAFHADMRRDKGLGPALGPDAGEALAEALRRRGRKPQVVKSPWRLAAPRDSALIAALADGHADAAVAPEDWRRSRRLAKTAEIGHLDVLSLP